MSDSDLVRASGLWLKDGKAGKFFSGEVDKPIPAGARVFVFRNTKKESDRQPDYVLNFVEPEPEPEPSAENSGGQHAPTKPPEDDIPF